MRPSSRGICVSRSQDSSDGRTPRRIAFFMSIMLRYSPKGRLPDKSSNTKIAKEKISTLTKKTRQTVISTRWIRKRFFFTWTRQNWSGISPKIAFWKTKLEQAWSHFECASFYCELEENLFKNKAKLSLIQSRQNEAVTTFGLLNLGQTKLLSLATANIHGYC